MGDVIFSDAHRVESAAYAESIDQGLFIYQTIEAVPFLEFQIVFRSQHPQDRVDGQRRVAQATNSVRLPVEKTITSSMPSPCDSMERT